MSEQQRIETRYVPKSRAQMVEHKAKAKALTKANLKSTNPGFPLVKTKTIIQNR